jgi:hypothetical protein
MECIALDFRCQCIQQKFQSICAVLTFDPQIEKILTFSVKDRYQLNYFICIKDLNIETITSLKLNLLSFFICCCQHHEMKTICLYIFLISDRYWATEHQYLFSRFLGNRTLKRHKSIEGFVVYIDTGSLVLYIPSKSRDLAEENNKILTEWK